MPRVWRTLSAAACAPQRVEPPRGSRWRARWACSAQQCEMGCGTSANEYALEQAGHLEPASEPDELEPLELVEPERWSRSDALQRR